MNLDKAINAAIQKTRLNMECICNDLREYTACSDGDYVRGNSQDFIELSHIFNWTQSFFTGMSYWAYKITSDDYFLMWNNQFYQQYYDKVFRTPLETMHDIGFLYTPYAVALYKATGDMNMKAIAIEAADVLAKRFCVNGRYIKAWGRMDDRIPDYVTHPLSENHFFTKSKGLAIIDSMMNLPLLYWASQTTRHPFYRKVASACADTVLENFIRADYSVCHAYYFDTISGEPKCEANYCGYDIGSHWARGTSWAIYGFAVAYSYTKNVKYLKAAVNLAEKFVALCEDDGIPVWDFRLPVETPALYCGDKTDILDYDTANSENKCYNRDTSACAITLCGIHEILKHVHNDGLKEYADKALNSLVEHYIDYSPDVQGLLKCQNGNMTYTIFGDYFMMEALAMWQHDFERIW